MNRRAFLLGGLGAAAMACTRQDRAPRVVDGTGATLPYPLYAKWAAEYGRVDPNVRINYQPLGSGAGVRQIADGVVDFGATDEPMSDAELARAERALVQIPTTIGAVVLAYRLDGIADLELTPELAADVFLGDIARWDDARLRAANPHAALPSEPIMVVHRADGSGTSAALTTFLGRHSPTFRDRVGAGKIARFPVGVGAKGSDGVSAFVRATPNTVGYVESAYARAAGLSVARIMNRKGKFVPPTLEAMDRAARGAKDLSIVDADDELAYPIAALSLVVVPREIKDRAKGEALVSFLWWAVHEGQRFAAAEGYAPLPPELVARAESALREVRAAGKPIVGGA